jgi:hypothetical protein
MRKGAPELNFGFQGGPLGNAGGARVGGLGGFAPEAN